MSEITKIFLEEEKELLAENELDLEITTKYLLEFIYNKELTERNINKLKRIKRKLKHLKRKRELIKEQIKKFEEKLNNNKEIPSANEILKNINKTNYIPTCNEIFNE